MEPARRPAVKGMRRRLAQHLGTGARDAQAMVVASLGALAMLGHLWSIGEQLTADEPPAPAPSAVPDADPK
ncbi:hypothetical protein [Streptomyces sp. NPDC020141]|uniref:hypothetical protein n=1 Tax=Streptomyces sp. NPDC020141 TaxID=3365065 RepID=UPI003788890F